jgi:hypothetical protein
MKCPYCEKEDFIPEVVFHHTHIYGDGSKNFNCVHCHKVVKMHGRRRAVLENPQKTDNESDWPFFNEENKR